MINSTRKRSTIRALAITGALVFVGACSSMPGMMMMSPAQDVTLVGANEVPPVMTTATATGTVTIKPDHSVSARIVVTGMTATAAHIHEGAAGTNGPVIVPFTKTADNTFEAPAGAMLTDAQYAAFKAGNLYVNAHSKEHPAGEIRYQLKAN
jgi:hypothetical protein